MHEHEHVYEYGGAGGSETYARGVAGRTRIAWTRTEGTSARVAFERIEHEGVGVLCASLAGHADRHAGEVSAIRDALDEIGAKVEPEVEVATLDVTGFANTPGDEAEILTSVLDGLPCCWITEEWDQQCGEDRWDLPRSEQMAATREEAIARVVSWRLAGKVTLGESDGTGPLELCWTERGLVKRAHEVEDLFHRNRLVERRIGGEHACTVTWPFPDRTGASHEALRRGARLVRRAGEIVEADFSPWQTRRPLAERWVDAIADLPSIRTLLLIGADPEPADVQRAVQLLPMLEELVVDVRTPAMQRVVEAIRRERRIRVR